MSGGFLSRWSRRKRRATAGQEERPALSVSSEPDAPAREPEPVGAGEEGRPPAALSPEEIAQLPPIEELTAEADLAPFLRRGVPNAIRNAAFRRLWSLDPSVRDFPGDARDYAYDWNTPGGVPGSGPLHASDDVDRALRHVIGGREDATAHTPEGSAPGLTTAAAPTAEPRAGPHTNGPACPAEGVGAPQPPAEPTIGRSSAVSGPAEPDQKSASKPGIGGRRHGGAVPV